MLPNAEYAPTIAGQGSIHVAVTALIRGQLLLPKFPIIFRHVATLGTTVPKAPVEEHDNAFAPERKVGTTCNREMSPPARYSIPSEKRCEPKLSVPVTARLDL